MASLRLHIFFSNEGLAFYYGAFTSYQRCRAVVVVDAWIAVFIFLGVQVYLGLGDVLGMNITRSYTLACISFFGEITGLILIYLLPVIAAMEIENWNLEKGSVMDEGRQAVLYGPWGDWPPLNLTYEIGKVPH